MPVDEEAAPSWMDEQNDENHSLMFSSNQDEEMSGGNNEVSSYGATHQDTDVGGEGKSVISTITTDDNNTLVTSGGTLEGPQKNIVLRVFNWVEGFAIFTCVILMVTQIFPLFFLGDINVGAYVLKLYISIFCVVFILVEYEAQVPFLKDSKILQNYFSRGFVYSFLGVAAMQEAYSERVQDTLGNQQDEFHVAWLGVFMQVAAWMMFSVGALYMLLSVCCMKKLRDKLQRDDKKKWREFRDAKRLLRSQGMV